MRGSRRVNFSITLIAHLFSSSVSKDPPWKNHPSISCSVPPRTQHGTHAIYARTMPSAEDRSKPKRDCGLNSLFNTLEIFDSLKPLDLHPSHVHRTRSRGHEFSHVFVRRSRKYCFMMCARHEDPYIADRAHPNISALEQHELHYDSA